MLVVSLLSEVGDAVMVTVTSEEPSVVVVVRIGVLEVPLTGAYSVKVRVVAGAIDCQSCSSPVIRYTYRNLRFERVW